MIELISVGLANELASSRVRPRPPPSRPPPSPSPSPAALRASSPGRLPRRVGARIHRRRVRRDVPRRVAHAFFRRRATPRTNPRLRRGGPFLTSPPPARACASFADTLSRSAAPSPAALPFVRAPAVTSASRRFYARERRATSPGRCTSPRPRHPRRATAVTRSMRRISDSAAALDVDVAIPRPRPGALHTGTLPHILRRTTFVAETLTKKCQLLKLTRRRLTRDGGTVT